MCKEVYYVSESKGNEQLREKNRVWGEVRRRKDKKRDKEKRVLKRKDEEIENQKASKDEEKTKEKVC